MKPTGALRRVAILCVSLPLLSAASSAQSPPETNSPSSSAAAQTPPQIPARITQAVDNHQRVTLQGNVHPLARPEFDRGALSDAAPMRRMLLVLKRSDDQEAALRKLLDDQQDKSSQSYHVWLTPQQFGQQFGPAASDVQAITGWLASQGFAGIKVAASGTAIEFSGNAGMVRSAFATEMHQYAVHGETHVANASDPQIPVALAPVVAGVASLNDFRPRAHSQFLGTFRKTKGGNVTPLFTFGTCGNTSCFGVGPADFATIYNTQPLLSGTPAVDGTGVNIAVVGVSDINIQDVRNFRTMFGLPANDPNIIVNGPDPGVNAAEGEADLDVQWAGGVAPGAKVDFVTSADTETTAGIDLSALYIVDNNIAPILSESFGACEKALGTAENHFLNSLWEEAAAQGITVILSAGDGGGAGCDDFNNAIVATQGLAVSGFASTPFNVAVGGTDFDQTGRESTYWKPASGNNTVTGESAISYIPEIPWNDSCGAFGLTGCANPPAGSLNIIAGSGGASTIYSKPVWQVGPGVSADNHRDLPDVSLFAGNGLHGSFYIICQGDANTSGTTNCSLNFGFAEFQGVGGTSGAAPSFAGIMALVNQKYGRQGNANYVLYALAQAQATAKLSCNSSSSPAAACNLNDITKGNNAVPCASGSLNCSSVTTGQQGVLVAAANSTTPAFTATAGYDLATGLGSVNAQSLVKNWNTVRTTPTTTTLTLNSGSAVNIVHGTSVSVKVVVTPGTASGDVSLIASGNFPNGASAGFDRMTLSGGTASGTTTALPGGSGYQVAAHYEGDGINAPSDSTPVTVTVTPEASKLLITVPTFNSAGQETGSTPTSLVYGSPYIVRVDATNASGTLCTPPSCPTGSVTLTDNISPGFPNSGTFALNSMGFTENLPVQFPGGAQTITANYGGDNSFSAAPTATYSLTVTPAPTVSQLAGPNGTTWVVGQSIFVQLIVSTQSSGVAPANDFALFDGSTQLPPVSATYISTNGSATAPASMVELISLPATFGSHTIKAVFNNDGADKNYQSSASGTFTYSAVYGTNIAATASQSNIILGQKITVTATVTSGIKSPTPTGTLTFSDASGQIGSPVTCVATTDSSGNSACTGSTMSFAPQQSEQINITYSGDPNFAQSSIYGAPVNVTIPDFSLSPANGSLTITAGQTGNATITVTPASNLSSTVALTCPNFPIAGATCTINPASVNLSNSTAASATLTIATTAPSSSTTTQSVPVAPPGDLFPPRSPGARGWWTVLGAFAGLAALLVLLLPRRRRYAMAFGLGLVCALSLSIGCGGGSAGNGSGQSGPVPTSLTLSASSTKVPSGQNVTLQVSATAARTPTGTVTLSDLTTQASLGTTPVAGGTARFNISLPVGTYRITASYSGDANTTPASIQTPLAITWTGTTVVNVVGNTSIDQHVIGFVVTIN